MSTHRENGKAGKREVTAADPIRCRTCKTVYRIGELKTVEGHEIPKMDGSGESWQQILYYCLRCQKVLACNTGNGNLVLMNTAKIAH